MSYSKNYYSERELQALGFRSLGRRVMISRDVRLLSPSTLSVGNYVLIDAFTIINGDVTLGDHVHISSNCEIFSGTRTKVIFEECSAAASFVSVYGQSDEYILPYLHNPTVPKKFKNVKNKDVIIGKYVIIGTHSVVLPGVELGEGCSFGALSLINKSTRPGGLYTGRPCRRVFDRDLEEIRRLAQELADEERKKMERSMARTGGSE